MTQRFLNPGLDNDLSPFVFNLAKSTFTPSMAIRTNTGSMNPFTTSPIVQGKLGGTGTGDKLISATPTSISGNFRNIGDGYQGSISIWITPENNWNDGVQRVVCTNFPGIALYKTSGNILNIYINGTAISSGVSTATWVAGTTYHVVLSWDTKNKIDGTNYCRISVNDTHTFFRSTSVTSGLPDICYIGGDGSANDSSNAVLQGLTIYRRVLWDGAYGQDVGNGDEIALIYASGAGKDPTEITGSWDVVFALPTNQTAGALTTGTGTGHAWSHPHSSNLLTDGWLANGYYGNQWGLGFNAGTANINCGSGATLDDLADNEFTFEAWIKYTSGSIVSKGNYGTGWEIGAGSGRIGITIFCATTNAYGDCTFNYSDGKWHHVVCYFNDAGDRKPYIAIDGVWAASYVVQTAGVGAIVSDAAYNLYIADSAYNSALAGTLGWVRISNNDRYTHGTNFVPPTACPAADANTIEQWLTNEGAGTTLTAVVTSPANDGAITAGTWQPQWYAEGTPIVPSSVALNGTSSYINCGSDAGLDDLADNEFTIEAWILAETYGAGNIGFIFRKGTGSTAGGFRLNIHSTQGYYALVSCATSAAITQPSSTRLKADGRWHHIVFYFNDAGDRKIYIATDGIWDTYTSQTAGVGAIVSDAATNLLLGNNDASGAGWDGNFAWTRVSNNARYTVGTNFTPASRFAPPAPDANTLAQWNMTERAGTTIDNAEGTAARDGTLVSCTWNNTPSMDVDAPGYRMFNWGYSVGTDSGNEGIKQTWTNLTAGSNYVARALAFTEVPYSGAALNMTIYDETNGAIITTISGASQYELVTAGDMTDATKWDLGAGWSIAAGVLHRAASAVSYAQQDNSKQANGGIVLGRLYKVTYTILNYVAGAVQIWAGANGIGAVRAADGTYTEYLRCFGAHTYIGFTPNAAFEGDIDNVSVTFVPEYNHPDNLMCSFELPTIARNGVAADCTSISVKVLSAVAGMLGVHQIELYTNLLDNPSLETGAVADPWIPDGWTNIALDAGDSERETVITHSSGASIQYNAGATAAEYIVQIGLAAFTYACYGMWSYGDSVKGAVLSSSGATRALLQRSLTAYSLASPTTQAWKHTSGIFRNVSARFALTGNDSTASLYIDDAYAIALQDVSLTVTPASQANSLEGTGIRVDGKDTLTQPVMNLKPTKGEIKFNWTPRHSAADAVKFGTSAPSIFVVRYDANNFSQMYWSGANNIRLEYNAGGAGTQTGNWNTTGLIAAGTTYAIKIKYTGGGMKLYVDGVERISIAAALAFSVVPTNAYWGHNTSNLEQSDAVFSAP